MDTKEFNFTNGNMGVETGSKSVITLNLNRITQDIAKKCNWDISDEKKRKKFYGNYAYHLREILQRVYKYHIAYNECLWDMYEAHLLPVYSSGFISLNKQYLTIGLNGLNQAAEFLGIKCNVNPLYEEFCQTIFGMIKESNTNANGIYFGHKVTFNTECVPRLSGDVKPLLIDLEIPSGQQGASRNVCMFCAA